jgi:hypothetical protein
MWDMANLLVRTLLAGLWIVAIVTAVLYALDQLDLARERRMDQRRLARLRRDLDRIGEKR